MALNAILSSPLLVQAGVPQGSVLGPVLYFPVFINHLSDWKTLFISLLMTPPSVVPSVLPLIGRQQPLHSLQIWTKSQTGPTLGACLSILTNLTLSLCLSGRTIWKKNPIYFLNNPQEEVLSFKLLGLTICHELSWESHISKLASKASRRLGIMQNPSVTHLSY